MSIPCQHLYTLCQQVYSLFGGSRSDRTVTAAHPVWVWFSYRQSFQYAFDNTLELILNTRPTSFSVLTHRCLWISVLLLNWNISGSNGSTAAISVVVMWNMVLSLCITAKWERFVSLHRHCKGHKLSFVIHNRVTKSKRKFGCLFTVFYLKSWLFCSLKLDFLSPHLPFLFNKRLLAWNFCRVFNDKCPWKKKINWREMKFPSGWKLRRRCGGLPSKSHKLCSSYKKQHVPKVLWTYARGPFSSLIIARAIKVLNSHAKCHQAPPVPFQKWYRHPCMWTTVCFAKVNRLVKYSSFFSFPPALWGGRNDLINNADLMYEIKYNLYSANVIQRSLL